MAMSLKAARVNQDLSQKEVGEIIGVSAATVCRWEKGISKIPKSQFTKLIKLYKKEEEEISAPVKAGNNSKEGGAVREKMTANNE